MIVTLLIIHLCIFPVVKRTYFVFQRNKSRGQHHREVSSGITILNGRLFEN